MPTKKVLIVAAIAFFVKTVAGAQNAKPPKTPPATPAAAAKGDAKSVVFNWMWYTGMLRGLQEKDMVATLELQATGTMQVNNQPCKLSSFRESINYQISGMRVQYECTAADGKAHKGIEVVSGKYAWDEDVVGAGLEPGRGTPKPNNAALNDRLIFLWAGPQGASKAAATGGQDTKVTMEGGKPVVTFPIPGVPGAVANATLSGENQAERVQVRDGDTVTEFTYSDYADYNPADDKVFGFLPGHIVEKRGGATILDLTVTRTEVGNQYVVVPVPDSVRNASITER